MEGENKGPKRVRWTPHLTQSLLGIEWECTPRTRSFPARLEDRWNAKHPGTPSTASALVQSVTRKRRKGVDQYIPTKGQIEARRPDLVIRMPGERKITILEVACAWEPLVKEREAQKKAK